MELVPEKEKGTAVSLNERCFDPDQDICNTTSGSNQCTRIRMGSEQGMLEIDNRDLKSSEMTEVELYCVLFFDPRFHVLYEIPDLPRLVSGLGSYQNFIQRAGLHMYEDLCHSSNTLLAISL